MSVTLPRPPRGSTFAANPAQWAQQLEDWARIAAGLIEDESRLLERGLSGAVGGSFVPLVFSGTSLRMVPPSKSQVVGVYSGYSGILTNTPDATQSWWSGTEVPENYAIVDVTAYVNRLTIEPNGPMSLVGGAVLLDQDPVDQLGVATKRYVDAHSGGSGGGIPEAPLDGTGYGRQDAAWTPVLMKSGDVLDGGNF